MLQLLSIFLTPSFVCQCFHKRRLENAIGAFSLVYITDWNFLREKKREILLVGTSTNEIGVNVTVRQGLEQKKSVTFDDGVKPGVETNAATIAATNIMSTHKIRTSEINTDQISSFKPGLIRQMKISRKKNRILFRLHRDINK